MSFLPWNDGEASLAETLVDQAMLPERPEPAGSKASLRKSSPRMSCMYAMCSAKGAKWARSRSAHFARIWSSSARWVVGSISLIFPGRQWSGGGSSCENHLSWSWRSHSFSSGEKFLLGLPSAAAMRRNHRLSQRSARSAVDKGWGSLPAARHQAVEVVRWYDWSSWPTGMPESSRSWPSCLPSSAVPWCRHIRTSSSPSVCLGEKDSSTNVSHRTLGMRSQRRV